MKKSQVRLVMDEMLGGKKETCIKALDQERRRSITTYWTFTSSWLWSDSCIKLEHKTRLAEIRRPSKFKQTNNIIELEAQEKDIDQSLQSNS